MTPPKSMTQPKPRSRQADETKGARLDTQLWKAALLKTYDAHRAAVDAGQSPDRLTTAMLATRFGKSPGTVRLFLHRERPAAPAPPATTPAAPSAPTEST